MKRILNIIVVVVLSSGLVSCGDLLNVNDPNYFTDDQMSAFIAEDPAAEQQVLNGMVGNLPAFINIYEAKINGDYSNAGAWEIYKDFSRLCQTGDIVEGTQVEQGSFSDWYQNLPSNTYWRTDQNISNYGYYLISVFKYGAAQRALDFITAEKAEKSPSMRASRAKALTLKASAYMMLMERYTDLTDVNSTSAQGWPIYDKYAYNTPQRPLSVKETWDWINNTLKEAVDLFKSSNLGDGGYNIGKESDKIYEIDCAVAQYYRARAALDCQKYDVVIEAGKDLLAHFPDFINAADYGMPASLLASVNQRTFPDATMMTSSTNPGHWTGTDFNASRNAFFNLEKNPEAIFGQARGASSWFWSLLGLNPLKRTASGCYQLDANLYNALSDNDCRKNCVLPSAFSNFYTYSNNGTDTSWVASTMPQYTSLKWGASSAIGFVNHTNESTVSDNIYLRSSAVLLMTAEAYAHLGKDAEAKALLDKLLEARTLPGKPKMTCVNTMSGSALDMVKLQWRIEMWGEGDWAFYNQKRWKSPAPRGANHWSSNPVPSEGWIWEIPREERQGNPYWN